MNGLLQSSDLKKVYDIFTDQSVELAVRRTAGEQLAVIVNGKYRHLFYDIHHCAGQYSVQD